ncbi:MAG: hypothetical protein IJ785_06130 [Bacteroidales bacterium]|nr:hypothetical protein [Bacteroidales bacterium]
MGNSTAEANKSIYSHTFVVGRLPGDLSPAVLNPSHWQPVLHTGFQDLCTKYYPALIDSMREYEGRGNRPGFLKPVRQYVLRLSSETPDAGVTTTMKIVERQQDTVIREADYRCAIHSVQLHFFPCNFVFFSIEIDDSHTDLNDMTQMHSQWKEPNDSYPFFTTPQLDTTLKPLLDLLPVGPDGKRLFTHQGTKARMYQIVQTADTAVQDDLLFEIATFMPIGVVNNTDSLPENKRRLKPSSDYFHRTLQENSVSAFDNWKALALNDSFTVLGCNGFNPYAHCHHYFPLLYMRCLFEEFFCFDRNDRFRSDLDGKTDTDVEQHLNEIHNMDRYYFYDDVSYDFLPSLMLRAMAKGMNLYADRDELVGHIKDSLDEERRRQAEARRRRSDATLLAVQILASASVFVALFNLINGYCDASISERRLGFFIVLLAIIALWLMFAYPKSWFPFRKSNKKK